MGTHGCEDGRLFEDEEGVIFLSQEPSHLLPQCTPFSTILLKTINRMISVLLRRSRRQVMANPDAAVAVAVVAALIYL